MGISADVQLDARSRKHMYRAIVLVSFGLRVVKANMGELFILLFAFARVRGLVSAIRG